MPRAAADSGEVYLSFDVEEFDAPIDFGGAIPFGEQIDVARAGLERIARLLERLDVPATFFCTAAYAEHDREMVRGLAVDHEIASHGWSHGTMAAADLARSREYLSNLTGRRVVGFRSPRLRAIEPARLRAAGYTYDSSINPLWVPGRYNHRREPRTIHTREGLTQIPLSTTPVLRVPLFWLAFKNLPLAVYERWCRRVLRHDGALTLYFHPWEFVDLGGYRLPGYVKRIDGDRLLARLETLVGRLAGTHAFGLLRDAAAPGSVPREPEVGQPGHHEQPRVARPQDEPAREVAVAVDVVAARDHDE